MRPRAFAGWSTAFGSAFAGTGTDLEASLGSSNGMPRRERTNRTAKLRKTADDSETDAELLCNGIDDAVAAEGDDANRILKYFQAWMSAAMLTA